MTKQRIPLSVARRMAERFVELAALHCERIEIAGSIRREKPEVGDIEIVAIPKMRRALTPGLFGLVEGPEESALWALTDQLSREGKLRPDAKAAKGERYRKFVVEMKSNLVGIDIFTTLDPATWGALLAIRTGSADFSKAVLQVGAWRERTCSGLVVRDRDGSVLPTPTEEAFFEAMGVRWIPPRQRLDGARVKVAR